MKQISLIILLSIFTLISCNKEEAQIITDDFKEKIEKKEAQLVDVRTSFEYNNGHIKNALLIDFNDTNFLTKALKTLDKSKPVYVYCQSGLKRSQNATKLLRAEGYNVLELKDGISAWQKKGYHIVKSNKEVIEILK